MVPLQVVFTGGPCVGKTSLVHACRKLGYPVGDEVATEVITEGRFLPWADPVAFRREVLQRQKAVESHLVSEHKPVSFLDRGAYDGIAYCLATGCNTPSFLADLGPGLYDVVFLLEPVPAWENDGIRYEDPDFTLKINPIFKDVYEAYGARVIPLPFMPIKDRLELVFARLREIGLNIATSA